MGELATLSPASAIRVNPRLAKPILRKLDKIIEIAAALQRWREMEEAIDFLIDCQREIVGWWDEHVRGPGGDQKSYRKTINVGARLMVTEAERQIALRQQAVSRFRSATADVDAYRARLIRRARREAGIDTASEDPSAVRPTPSRDGSDFWRTPLCLTNALVRHVIPDLPQGPIWECAASDGRLARAIASTGRKVVATDVEPQADGIEARDFIRDALIPENTIVVTNPPYNHSDEFLARCLALFDEELINGFVLLHRHDHLQASSRVEAFNRATREVHCNWRPIWIDGTEGQPRWSFHWIVWTNAPRQPPLYLQQQ
jgi:hypothetical protein